MSYLQTKADQFERRERRTRAKLNGTAERPRLSVFRSSQHIYVQVIDDASAKTLVAISTLTAAVKGGLGEANKTEAARKVGEAVAKACIEKGLTKVVFDRGGYMYHGRVSALADAARKAGLQF